MGEYQVSRNGSQNAVARPPFLPPSLPPSLPPYLGQINVIIEDLRLALRLRIGDHGGGQLEVEVDHVFQLRRRERGREGG